MPSIVKFNGFNSLAGNIMRNNTNWFFINCPGLFKCINNFVKIMAVYIDNMPIERVTAPVMIGIAPTNRVFVVFKVKDRWVDPYLEILFQRYDNIKSSWSNSSTGYGQIFEFGGHWISEGKINKDVADNIKRLIGGDKVLVRNYMNEIEERDFKLVTN